MNPDGIWRKSSYSSFEGNCVEVARGMVQVGIRNSRDPDGPRLLLSYPHFRALIDAAKAGELDRPVGARRDDSVCSVRGHSV